MDTRQTLLDAAESVARRRGYDGFSYADLAEAVGIRKASIHYHFPKKSDLSVALIERYTEQVAASLAEIRRRDGRGASALKAFVEMYRNALEGGRSLCLCVAMSSEPESLSAESVGALNAFNSMILNWLSDEFQIVIESGDGRELTTADGEARAALALMQGAHLLGRAAQSVVPFDQAVAPFLRRLDRSQ